MRQVEGLGRACEALGMRVEFAGLIVFDAQRFEDAVATGDAGIVEEDMGHGGVV